MFFLCWLGLWWSCGAGPGGRLPDIVIVALDTVRWDRTGLSGYERETTPHLDQFASLSGATTFTQAYTDAAWSLPAYASLFTGRGPLEHGVGFTTSSVDPGHATLAQALSAYGYDTAGFASGPHLHSSTGLSRGFGAWRHDEGIESMTPAVIRALHWLDERKDEARPVFLFVHGYDAHVPYTAPAPMSEMFDPDYRGALHAGPSGGPCSMGSPNRACMPVLNQGMGEVRVLREQGLTDRDLTHIRAHYDSAVRGADYQLGRLLKGLEERSVLDDALVVVLSDHGEALGEGERFGHDTEVGDEVFHVPLVVKTPTGGAPARWGGMVSLSDVLPSVLSSVGAVQPAGVEGEGFVLALGRNKEEPGQEERVRAASICCYWVRSNQWELRGWKDPHRLRASDRRMQWQLYEGGVGMDVARDHPQVVEELRREVAHWPTELGRAAEVRHGPEAARPKMRRALREQGYWAPDGGEVR